jgi:hypothetical protein
MARQALVVRASGRHAWHTFGELLRFVPRVPIVRCGTMLAIHPKLHSSMTVPI